MKVLLDTCVVIDALQNRMPFAPDAQNIFRAAAKHKLSACLSAKSVTDIYYLVHKQNHSDAQARQALQKLFEIVDTKGLHCINAVTSLMSDYEDAVMSECAYT